MPNEFGITDWAQIDIDECNNEGTVGLEIQADKSPCR